jgi:hypothetical protein
MLQYHPVGFAGDRHSENTTACIVRSSFLWTCETVRVKPLQLALITHSSLYEIVTPLLTGRSINSRYYRLSSNITLSTSSQVQFTSRDTQNPISLSAPPMSGFSRTCDGTYHHIDQFHTLSSDNLHSLLKERTCKPSDIIKTAIGKAPSWVVTIQQILIDCSERLHS